MDEIYRNKNAMKKSFSGGKKTKAEVDDDDDQMFSLLPQGLPVKNYKKSEKTQLSYQWQGVKGKEYGKRIRGQHVGVVGRGDEEYLETLPPRSAESAWQSLAPRRRSTWKPPIEQQSTKDEHISTDLQGPYPSDWNTADRLKEEEPLPEEPPEPEPLPAPPPRPVKKPKSKPKVEPKPSPPPSPVKEPKPEPKIEPKPSPPPSPVKKPKPEPKIEPKPSPPRSPVKKPKPEPKIEPKPSPPRSPVKKPKPEPKIEPLSPPSSPPTKKAKSRPETPSNLKFHHPEPKIVPQPPKSISELKPEHRKHKEIKKPSPPPPKIKRASPKQTTFSSSTYTKPQRHKPKSMPSKKPEKFLDFTLTEPNFNYKPPARDCRKTSKGPNPLQPNNNFDGVNYSVLPARTAAFKAPFVPLCDCGTSGAHVTVDDQGNVIDCEEDGVNFCFKPRPNFATEISFTVEPQKKPTWQTMMNCGFTPLIYCNVPPCCLPGDCSSFDQSQRNFACFNNTANIYDNPNLNGITNNNGNEADSSSGSGSGESSSEGETESGSSSSESGSEEEESEDESV